MLIVIFLLLEYMEYSIPVWLPIWWHSNQWSSYLSIVHYTCSNALCCTMKCSANVHTQCHYIAMYTVLLYSVHSVTMYTVITMWLYTVLTQCHLYSDTVFTIQRVTMQCQYNVTIQRTQCHYYIHTMSLYSIHMQRQYTVYNLSL